jgi:hypothetical protein
MHIPVLGWSLKNLSVTYRHLSITTFGRLSGEAWHSHDWTPQIVQKCISTFRVLSGGLNEDVSPLIFDFFGKRLKMYETFYQYQRQTFLIHL